MIDFFSDIQLLFNDYTFRVIGMGTAVLGIICGMLGSFTVLRKQSLLGDAISHAALPGIAIAFLITGEKNPILFFAGAVMSGIVGTIWITSIVNNTFLKADTALGIILSVFFGFGILLITFIQKQPNANQAGLDKYLFGQAATLMLNDVWLMVIVGLCAFIIVLVFWKEFKILTFDAHYAKTLGFNIKFLELLLTILIVVAIVIGLQTVGVVLMSAMLLAPAAAARQWTNRLGIMILLAALFGAIAGISGTIISASGDKLSTGPLIVLCAISIVAISFIFAPNRGLVFRQLNYIRNRKDLKENKALSFMYTIVADHDNISHPHSIDILNDFKGYEKKCLRKLETKGFILLNNNFWSLTEKGIEFAKNIINKQNLH